MDTVGRIATSLALGVLCAALQQIGCFLIRSGSGPLNLWELAGTLVIGASWLAVGAINGIWAKRRTE